MNSQACMPTPGQQLWKTLTSAEKSRRGAGRPPPERAAGLSSAAGQQVCLGRADRAQDKVPLDLHIACTTVKACSCSSFEGHTFGASLLMSLYAQLMLRRESMQELESVSFWRIVPSPEGWSEPLWTEVLSQRASSPALGSSCSCCMKISLSEVTTSRSHKMLEKKLRGRWGKERSVHVC